MKELSIQEIHEGTLGILKKIIDPITKWLDKITFEDNKQKII